MLSSKINVYNWLIRPTCVVNIMLVFFSDKDRTYREKIVNYKAFITVPQQKSFNINPYSLNLNDIITLVEMFGY